MFRRHHAGGRHWHHSIRKRLVALFLLLALCSSAVFLFGMQRVVRSGWQAWAQPLVADYVNRLAADVLPPGGQPPDLARARAIADELPIALRVEGPAVPGRVWDSHPDSWRSRFRADGIDAVDGFEKWGLVRSRDDGHRVSFRLRAAPDAMRPRLFGWITLGALLLLTAAAWFAVRRTLAPLASIGAGVEAFGRGRFDTPIPVRRRDELGELAERINGMAANLSGMLDAKRALLLSISHELRSPLTRARVNAELLPESSPERAALLRDLGEMRELITALLEGERLAQGHTALQPQPLDLAALVHEVIGTHFARQAPTLDLQPPPSPVAADPVRLKLLLRNLIDNALRHSASGAPAPVVFLRVDGDQLVLGVRDHGHGHELDDAQLAQLGEAFYRPDSARTRAGGGVGLGLYLCRLVAQAHGGTLRIRRSQPGLEIAAEWPMRPMAQTRG